MYMHNKYDPLFCGMLPCKSERGEDRVGERDPLLILKTLNLQYVVRKLQFIIKNERNNEMTLI